MFNDTNSTAGYKSEKDIGMDMNDEYLGAWKETAITYFKVISIIIWQRLKKSMKNKRTADIPAETWNCIFRKQVWHVTATLACCMC
jgi:hypothetical protein